MDQSMIYNIVEASDNPVQEWLPAEDLGRTFKGRTESIVGLEIGTDTGISTRYLLDMIPGLKLYGIDPYTNYIDWNNRPVRCFWYRVRFGYRGSNTRTRFDHNFFC